MGVCNIGTLIAIAVGVAGQWTVDNGNALERYGNHHSWLDVMWERLGTERDEGGQREGFKQRKSGT